MGLLWQTTRTPSLECFSFICLIKDSSRSFTDDSGSTPNLSFSLDETSSASKSILSKVVFVSLPNSLSSNKSSL